MSRFVLKNHLLTCLFFKIPSSSPCNTPRVFFSLPFSTITDKHPANNTPTVYEFLTHRHHFSHEAASKIASALTRLKNPERFDPLLSFFRASGFSTTQLEKVLTYRPRLLSADLENIMMPKIKLFQDLGYSGDEIADIISRVPSILHCSVNEKLIPSFSVLEGLFGSKAEVAKVLGRSGWFLIRDLKKTLVPNVEFLKSCGVPMKQMIKLMSTFSRFFLLKPETVRKFVGKVDGMGVQRSSGLFIYAIRTVCSISDEKWEMKLKKFRDLGFSEDDILRVFRSAPTVFLSSEKKIEKIIEVLVGTGKYDISSIIRSPTSLMHSVEKRYRPRLRVLGVLENKGLIEEWPCLGSLHVMSNENFFRRFVSPYLDNHAAELDVAWSDGACENKRDEEKKSSLGQKQLRLR